MLKESKKPSDKFLRVGAKNQLRFEIFEKILKFTCKNLNGKLIFYPFFSHFPGLFHFIHLCNIPKLGGLALKHGDELNQNQPSVENFSMEYSRCNIPSSLSLTILWCFGDCPGCRSPQKYSCKIYRKFQRSIIFQTVQCNFRGITQNFSEYHMTINALPFEKHRKTPHPFEKLNKLSF